jgi:hypothetical protein
VKHQRRFPVPASARSAILGAAATADQLDLAATLGSHWAASALVKERTRLLASVCNGDDRLPAGVLESDPDEIVVTGLVRDGAVWHGDGWEVTDEPVESIPLDGDEVAFVARALLEGCPRVLLRGYTPVAVIPETGFWAAGVPGAGSAGTDAGDDDESRQPDLPEGARVLAVVDDLDRNAVLDLVAVLPGPKVLRRHDGTWQEDPAWVNILRSVRPPPVVLLDDAQTASVLPQVDEATAGRPFSKEPPKKATAASGIDQRADEMAVEFAVLAAVSANPARKAASKLTPGGTMPGQLQRYWVAGPGAAKIRWGTPGAMTRCARQLAKYVTPARAYATCNNISKKLGGKGIAWGVGD